MPGSPRVRGGVVSGIALVLNLRYCTGIAFRVMPLACRFGSSPRSDPPLLYLTPFRSPQQRSYAPSPFSRPRVQIEDPFSRYIPLHFVTFQIEEPFSSYSITSRYIPD